MDEQRVAGGPGPDGRRPSDRPQSGTGESLGDTLTGIIQNIQDIIRGEVELAKTELKEDATKMGKGAGMLGGAAFLGLVGFIFLMLAVTYLLNLWLDMWISAGIVAIALLVIGGIVGMMGKKQIDEANLKPEKTIDSLKEDKEWASRQMNSVTK